MKPSILIVEAPFYPHIAKGLRDGAIAVLDAAGARFEQIAVPGALEIPPAILFAARAAGKNVARYDGFVALGCVIRGETYHFEIVAGQSAAGLMELGLQHGLSIGNGILTCETEEQAIARAAPDGGNKGGDAARACLALIELRAQLEGAG
ncbi:MAG TPA: 6,7-dimethyl-8-ribityllumazine synthase [Rhizomicrobium sp.]|nr:6,7-dimethyl-8-ribityllumazine synthase [Rhizomicrobium sp.]